MYISEVYFHFQHPSLQTTINMAPTVTLVPGRKKNQFNAVLDGFRFCKNKKKNGNTYYRCTFFSSGCKARITLDENNDLVSPTPDHNHESQVAETHVHVVKQDLKRKAATSDLPTKYLVAEATGRLNEETRQKLNCDLNALYKMTRSDMDPFVEYFERTWIGTSSRRPLFDHTKWNHHDDILLDLPRSSNLAEGWHHGFHTMMGCSNPTIWKFLDVLKKEQNLTDVKVAQHPPDSSPRREPRSGPTTMIDFDVSSLTMILIGSVSL